jgi:hypothetical protein
MSASYLDLHLKIDSEGWLRTKLYDKRDDLNLPIVHAQFVHNIHADCLLKNTSDNKYVVNQKLDYVHDISFR